MDHPPDPLRDADHLSTYVQSIAAVTERFGRIAREQRLMAEQWQRLAARLRDLADRDEE